MNRAALVRFSLGVLLLAGAAGSRSQNSLEIITLRHRTAQQVLPAVQPLVEPGGTLSGSRNQLIVRTSAANLAEIRRALDAIDRPAQRLQISVRFDDSLERTSRTFGASGQIGTGGSAVEIRARGSAAALEERVDQRVQVLEGGRATIYTGESRPTSDSRIGFDVVPRLAGSRVELDIATANGFTTAAGPLGEWFEIAALARSRGRDERGLASSAARSTSEARSIWVKVERLP
jgi:hypothetical protein